MTEWQRERERERERDSERERVCERGREEDRDTEVDREKKGEIPDKYHTCSSLTIFEMQSTWDYKEGKEKELKKGEKKKLQIREKKERKKEIRAGWGGVGWGEGLKSSKIEQFKRFFVSIMFVRRILF